MTTLFSWKTFVVGSMLGLHWSILSICNTIRPSLALGLFMSSIYLSTNACMLLVCKNISLSLAGSTPSRCQGTVLGHQMAHDLLNYIHLNDAITTVFNKMWKHVCFFDYVRGPSDHPCDLLVHLRQAVLSCRLYTTLVLVYIPYFIILEIDSPVQDFSVQFFHNTCCCCRGIWHVGQKGKAQDIKGNKKQDVLIDDQQLHFQLWETPPSHCG